MVINNNVAALSTGDHLATSHSRLAKSLARISSGARIVQPGDDAAGLAVGTRMDAKIHRIEGARDNVGNATSFVQTQDGYLKHVARAFDRMSELSILAMDATKSDDDRLLYDKEFAELKGYVTNASTKDFNGVKLFSTDALDVTIDADGATLQMAGIDMQAGPYATAIASGSGVGTIALAKQALTDVKAAMDQLASDRATIGAYQSRLSYAADELTVSRENLTAASSRIQDTDVAEESTAYARANILLQSSTAMLAQANQIPQNVLRLLQ